MTTTAATTTTTSATLPSAVRNVPALSEDVVHFIQQALAARKRESEGKDKVMKPR